ncbi:hypothetical protein CBM2606_A90277 [Cupriavidus taiwanensis]|nr:hypothetical protein CBM2606_A90277 [Cupriavidus taiwanensis]
MQRGRAHGAAEPAAGRGPAALRPGAPDVDGGPETLPRARLLPEPRRVAARDPRDRGAVAPVAAPGPVRAELHHRGIAQPRQPAGARGGAKVARSGAADRTELRALTRYGTVARRRSLPAMSPAGP